MLGCHPGQFSFILRAASDTLPTAVNLQRWRIQCDAKCTLCGCVRPTTSHVLGGCPVALSQDRFTYRHDQVLHCLASQLSDFYQVPIPFMSMLTYQVCGPVNLLRELFLHPLS